MGTFIYYREGIYYRGYGTCCLELANLHHSISVLIIIQKKKHAILNATVKGILTALILCTGQSQNVQSLNLLHLFVALS